MCGILALFDGALSAAELEALCKRLTSLLSHRGPDEVGCHVGGGFALGHARLSIMDPAHGHQPLVHAPTGNAVVHNGEIYNHAELRERAALEAAAARAPPVVYATHSDSESILPLFETHGAHVAAMLDGMFAFVAVRPDGTCVAARDPCGIKPLYRGWSASGRVLFASELKCLVGHVEHAEEFPAGHLWTAEGGYERYFAPDWLRPTLDPAAPLILPTGGVERVRGLLKRAVAKRLMSDVGYGLLLSGGLDSAIVCALMAELTDMSKIKSFTVGMPNSPDIMAAREVAKHFGTVHHEYLFSPDEAFAMVPQVVYHLETYEPELIRSSIPNYFLAKLAGAHTKVVLTGEGADELFAGYLYFRDCPDREAMQRETLRIWGHLHNVNLQRSDRMGMAHGLEARVPFLDVELLEEAYGRVDPAAKMHTATKAEKHALRALFEGEIPHDVLWRTKAMQCEGVGTDWVSILQAKCAAAVSDAEFGAASATFPLNPPQSKEEFYYRKLFAQSHAGMDHFVHVWEGGCRAGGAAWQSAVYTRAGLADTAQLRHALMDADKEGEDARGEGLRGTADGTARSGASDAANASAIDPSSGAGAKRNAADPLGGAASSLPSGSTTSEVMRALADAGVRATELHELLGTGGDSRISLKAGVNKYGIPATPQPRAVVRSSCTSSPPTAAGYAAAAEVLARMASADGTIDAFGAEMRAVRTRIATALKLPAGSEVVLAPSGVEAEYIGMLVAQQLHPHARLHSIVAAAGEVGTATAEAARCVSYDNLTPFCAPTARAPTKGSLLDGFAHIEQFCVPARDATGKQSDEAAAIGAHIDAVAAASAEPIAWVVRQVAGTKTGFTTSLPDAASACGALPADALVVIDACQLRVSCELVHSYLRQGQVVLITGSKFVHGASFSAAILIPPELAQRLEAVRDAPPLPVGLGAHFSAHEMPDRLSRWAEQLHRSPNLGLLLRWHTALPMLERLCALPDGERTRLEDAWAASVAQLVERQPRLSVLSREAGIVSFTCARPSADEGMYGLDELAKVHRWLQEDFAHVQGARPCAHRSLVCFIGQAVAITRGVAVLRIASSADLLVRLHDGAYELAMEEALVDKIGWLIESYDAVLDAALR